MTTRRRVAAGAAVLILLAAAAIGWRLRGGRGEAADPAAARATASAAGERGRAEARDPSARGAIEGSVRDPGGGPIPGATVCGQAWSNQLTDEETRDPVCAATSPDGRYRLSGLLPAAYLVAASAPGYASAGYESGRPGDPLELGPGETRAGVDLVLRPGGAEVTGVVVDLGGGPVAGAWVVAHGWVGGASPPTRSQADGSFRLWIAPGTVELRAWADGYAGGSKTAAAPADGVQIFLTPESVLAGRVVEVGTGAPVAAARVTVGDFDALWSEIGATAASARTDDDGRFRLTRLSPGRYKPSVRSPRGYGQARASVLLGLGQTVDDLVIELHPAATVNARVVVAGRDTPCETGLVSLSTAKGMDVNASIKQGRAAVEAVLPGTYEVNVRCRGFLSEESYPAVVVTAGAPPPEPVWTVRAGGRIRGTVRGADGSPAAKVSVAAALGQAGEDRFRGSAWTTTEADGRFTMDGLRAGSYVLSVYPSDQPGPVEPLTAVVPEGGEVTVDIRLDAGGGVAGEVVDDRGTPLVGVQVYARSLQAWQALRGSAWTGRGGRFALSGLRPGSYRVMALSDASGVPQRAPGQRDDDEIGVKVAVEAGRTAEARIVIESRSGVIRGRVADPNGAPITDAFVDAERESGSAAAAAGTARLALRWAWSREPVLTDTDGRFAVDKLAPGTYTVVAYRRGGGEAVATGIAAGGSVDLTIRPTGSIAGAVKGSGPPPERFTVDVTDRSTGLSRTESFFRTAGAFAVADLPAGTFAVSVRAAEGTGRTEVVLAEGRDVTGLTVTLESLAIVTGRVVSLDDGAPIGGLSVMVTATDGGFAPGRASTTTDAAGRFTVDDAPAGRVQIGTYSTALDPESYGFTSRAAVLPPGRATDVGDLRVVRSRVKPGQTHGDLGYKLKESAGVEQGPETLTVAVIRPGGPAARAGLEVGDVITAVDGHDVTGDLSLHASLTSVPPGTTVTLGLARGASLRVTATDPP